MPITAALKPPVMLITLKNPHKRNAVSRLDADQLVECFQRFEKEPRARVAVLYGEGGFCAGADLTRMDNRIEQVKGNEKLDSTGPMGPSRMRISKPVIAAITGHAVAGGLELALWCDLRVAEEGSVFGVFCRRFGVPLIDGGTFRLPRIIGHGRALDLILTGRPVYAKEALAIGLVSRIVEKGRCLREAMELANTLAHFPQKCMLLDRGSVYGQWGLSERQALKLEGKRATAARVLEKEAFHGARAFAERGEGRGGKARKDQQPLKLRSTL